jgi:1,4-dihydroxy-2-naphthoate octaprenyltransferase
MMKEGTVGEEKGEIVSLTFMGPCIVIIIPIYIQQDATLHSLFYLKTALHVSGGTTTRHQERIKLYLEHLVFFTPLLLPAAIVEKLEIHSGFPTLPR